MKQAKKKYAVRVFNGGEKPVCEEWHDLETSANYRAEVIKQQAANLGANVIVRVQEYPR